MRKRLRKKMLKRVVKAFTGVQPKWLSNGNLRTLYQYICYCHKAADKVVW